MPTGEGPITVEVRLFAILRERVGASRLPLDLPAGATANDAVASLHAQFPHAWSGEAKLGLAVNREYCPGDTVLHHGDELALIPPVSGGSEFVNIADGPIDIGDVRAKVTSAKAGAVVVFEGVTREVPSLEYEAYIEMALPELQKIVAAATEAHGLIATAVTHRVGTVPLSEPSVVIAVSAPHRAEAFAGARQIIDELKVKAPIWKKEQGEWCHPQTDL